MKISDYRPNKEVYMKNNNLITKAYIRNLEEFNQVLASALEFACETLTNEKVNFYLKNGQLKRNATKEEWENLCLNIGVDETLGMVRNKQLILFKEEDL